MRDEPSRTAQSVAAAEFLLSYDPILGDLVPREAVAPTRWCLESVPGFHGKLYHLLRWGWLRRYLRFLERKYIPGITAHVGLRKRWIEENVRNVKISSPDYIGWPSAEAVKHYLDRMSAKIPHFETMEENDLNWIKVFLDRLHVVHRLRGSR